MTENRKQLHSRSSRLSFEALRALAAFADAGNVADAASALGTTQPTMSHKLEVWRRNNVLGAAVLERKGRRLQLTEYGREILPAVRDLVRQYQQLLESCNGQTRAKQVVHIGVGSFSAEHYLAPALAELRRFGHTFQVVAEAVRGRDRIIGVADGRFDMAIVTHDALQIKPMVSARLARDETLEVEPLGRQVQCAVAKKGTQAGRDLEAASAGRTVRIEALAHFQLVGLDPRSGLRRLLERELRRKKLDLRFLSEGGAGGWAGARAYARHGLGVALVPLAALQPEDVRELTIRRLPDSFGIAENLIYRRGEPNTAQRELRAALVRAAAGHQKEVRNRWKILASGG
jgi:DNA-binding transcriptional LysR family regulator